MFADPQLMLLTAIGIGIGLVIGYLTARLKAQQEIQKLSVENARLETELEGDEEHYESQMALLHEARDNLTKQFALLSQRALKQNNSLFLKLAEQSVRLQHLRANAELEKRQRSVDTLLAPVRDALSKTQQQLKEIEQERQAAFAGLGEQIKSLSSAEINLRSETRNLVNALKRPDVRGRWGEMTLKRLVELAGMVEFADFTEQPATEGQNRMRPDLIVRMPDNRELIIDAKTSLSGYLEALDAKDEQTRNTALQQHAKNLRARMKELSLKSYWAQFKKSPDYVVLFVPGDQFLSAALEHDENLLEDSLKNRVVLATPSTLIALLRAVAFGWRQSAFSENAEKIRAAGEELYARVATLTEHYQKLGKGLRASVESYNKTLDTLEKQIIPSAKRMADMGVEERKPIAELNDVDTAARKVSGDDEINQR
ncbi:MAG: DNA recombination protein RmuC [Thiotrichales bacterium]